VALVVVKKLKRFGPPKILCWLRHCVSRLATVIFPAFFMIENAWLHYFTQVTEQGL